MSTINDESSSTPSFPVIFAVTGLVVTLFRFAGVLIVGASRRDDDEEKKNKIKDDRSSKKSSDVSATVVTENTSLLHSTTQNGSEADSESDEDLDWSLKEKRDKLKRMSHRVSWWSHIVLSLAFLKMAIMSASSSVSGGNVPSDNIWSGSLLWWMTLVIVFNGSSQLLDKKRKFFGMMHRLFYLTSAFSLASVGVYMVIFRSGSITKELYDILLLSVVILYYPLLVIVECRLTPPPESGPLNSSEKQTLSTGALFSLLKPYVWPDAATDPHAVRNRCLVLLTWSCVIGTKVCNLYAPLLLGWASTALAQSDYDRCVWLSVSYAAFSFLSKVLKEGQSLAYLKVAQAAFVSLSKQSFWHLHHLSLDWHLRKKLGTVLRSMDRGIGACDTLMKYLFLWLVPAAFESIMVCVIFAAYFHYAPLSVTVFAFVFCYSVLTIVLTLWRKKFRQAVAKSDNKWHDVCTDSLVNFETVKYFTAEDYEQEKFGEAVSHYQAGSVKVQASLSTLNIAQQVLYQACLATCLTLATWGIRARLDCCRLHGDESHCPTSVCPGMQIGDFVAVLTYTTQLFAPLNFLGTVYNAIVMAFVDLTNLSELMAEEATVTDMPDAVELPLPTLNAGRIEDEKEENQHDDDDVAVEFDDVYFHYPTQVENSGLRGVSFKMKRGQTTAIVGSTGAGKTTVSRLLFRFYDVLHGAVKINGVDVRCVTQHSLRRAIGFVPQATSLFNDTIRHNILYGRLQAGPEELDQVARDAQLSDFLASLPQGWDTVVGDRGLKLSGGEKQRVAIARCLLKDPPIVVLDEATSALDTLTENSVQLALERLGQDRTCLVIAHRLGTIRNADNIVVLDDGVVAEQGTHEELLEIEGLYANMWNMQLHTGGSSTTSLTSLGRRKQQGVVITEEEKVSKE